MSSTKILKVVFIVSLVFLLSVFAYKIVLTDPVGVEYDYDVTIEDVDDHAVNEQRSTNLEDLSGGEEEVVSKFLEDHRFDAYSREYIGFNESVGDINSRRLVDYNGIYYIMHIEGPDKHDEYPPWGDGLVVSSLVALFSFIGSGLILADKTLEGY